MAKSVLDITGLTHFISKIKEFVTDSVSSKAEADLSNVTSANFNGKSFDSQVITTAGTGAAYTATVPGITALEVGVSFIMVPHTVSTTTSTTLNVNGLGAKNLRQPLTASTGTSTTGKSSNWITSGKPIRVTYDGTLWRVDIPRPSATALYGTVPISSGGTGAITAEAARTNLGISDGVTQTVLYENTSGYSGEAWGTPITVGDPADYDYFVVDTMRGKFPVYKSEYGNSKYISGGTITSAGGGGYYFITVCFSPQSSSNPSGWYIYQNSYFSITANSSSNFSSSSTNTIYKIIGVKL